MLLVVSAVGVALTARLFLWPQSDSPRQVDAVIVLSGDRGERLARGLELIRAGVSSILVLDGTPDSLEVLELCRGGRPFEVICLRPEPDSTRQEARAAAQLALARNWDRVAVVTTTSHLTRSALLFRRCLQATVVMVEGYRWPSMRAVVHEWLGLGQALILARGC